MPGPVQEEGGAVREGRGGQHNRTVAAVAGPTDRVLMKSRPGVTALISSLPSSHTLALINYRAAHLQAHLLNWVEECHVRKCGHAGGDMIDAQDPDHLSGTGGRGRWQEGGV